MRRGGIGDVLIPAHPRNPRGGLVKGTLCHGQCRVMAVNVQLATDGASECFARMHLFYHKQAETDTGRSRKAGSFKV
jgi:hypothetical protein